MRVDAHELRVLAGSFRSAAFLAYPQAEERISIGAYAIEARAKALAPVDTGALRSSISTDINGLDAEIGPTVEYGGFVERGTDGPYPIPNAFGWGITVMHPGNAPEPYLGPAYDTEIDPIVDSLADLGDI